MVGDNDKVETRLEGCDLCRLASKVRGPLFIPQGSLTVVSTMTSSQVNPMPGCFKIISCSLKNQYRTHMLVPSHQIAHIFHAHPNSELLCLGIAVFTKTTVSYCKRRPLRRDACTISPERYIFKFQAVFVSLDCHLHTSELGLHEVGGHSCPCPYD